MDSLINALLDLSRIGKRAYHHMPIDTSQIVQRCLDAMAFEIGRKKVEVFCPLLPKIVSDPIILDQIFGNVLDNAVKYLRDDQSGQISITAHTGSEDVVLSIADNGRGIAEADRSKIFEIFRRARNTSDIRGLGMGMAFVRTGLRKLGGAIWFESRVGEGTTFSIKIPGKPI